MWDDIIIRPPFKDILFMELDEITKDNGSGIFHGTWNEILDDDLCIFWPHKIKAKLIRKEIDHLGSMCEDGPCIFSIAWIYIIINRSPSPCIGYFVPFPDSDHSKVWCMWQVQLPMITPHSIVQFCRGEQCAIR